MKSAPRQKKPKVETTLAAKAKKGSESSAKTSTSTAKGEKSADSKVDLKNLSIEEGYRMQLLS
jgi:hypothetical protein